MDGADTFQVTYLGQCCFLIETENLRIVTDPYLSSSVDKDIPGWQRAYAPPCTLKELAPDLVLISHAHDDHMDLTTIEQYIEEGGKAAFAAPAPVTEPLKKLGCKVIDARAEQVIKIKEAQITPLPCAHTQLHTDELGRFCELSYVLDFGGCCAFFGGDMSLYDGLKERVLLENCDVLLLPCNGRDEERTNAGIIGNTTAEEAAAFAAALGAPFIPAHHDLYPANGRDTAEIVSAAKEASAQIVVLQPGESAEFPDFDDDFDGEEDF